MEESSPEFVFKIDFVRGEGAASRVLLAANDFVQACERLDAELVKSVHSGIEAVVVLDDIQSGSLKLILRSVLRSIDDEAIKHLDWKQAVGSFLLKGKRILLAWADDEGAPRQLPEVRRALLQAATETDVRQIPGYAPPSPAVLIRALQDLQAVKERLIPGDRAYYLSPEGDHELDQNVRWTADQIESLAVKETISQPPAVMILAVKKPDYLGVSRWELRHGKRPISAAIADLGWLGRFQNRDVDVRPGDALKCEVVVELLYGYDNELIAENYSVTKVTEVLRDQLRQADLLAEG
jgi:hypothetical protein